MPERKDWRSWVPTTNEGFLKRFPGRVFEDSLEVLHLKHVVEEPQEFPFLGRNVEGFWVIFGGSLKPLHFKPLSLEELPSKEANENGLVV